MNKSGQDRAAKCSQLTQLHEAIRAPELEARLLSATQRGETAAERARKLRAAFDRQITALAADAENWRAAATLSHVDASLTTYPEIRSALLRIGEIYDSIADAAMENYERLIRKRSAA
jgi:hypothetical protein